LAAQLGRGRSSVRCARCAPRSTAYPRDSGSMICGT